MSYIIVPPGGPSGPFYGIIKAPEGIVIAMQITSKKWAERLVDGLKFLDAYEKGESHVADLEEKGEE